MTPKPRCKDIFSSILLVSKFLGVFPFDHVLTKVSPLWALYSFTIIFVSSVQVGFIVFDPPNMVKASLIHSLLYKCQMLAFFGGIVIFNLFIVLKRGRLQELLKGISSFRGTSVCANPSFKAILSFCFFQVLVVSLTAAFDIKGNEPLNNRLWFSLCYYYGMILIITAGSLPFVSILELIFCGLETITTKLKLLQTVNNSKFYVNDLLKYVTLYNKLNNSLVALNDIFNCQLLFISFVSFINVTTNMFFTVDYLVDYIQNNDLSKSNRTKLMPVFSGWITIFASLVCFPIHCCQRAVQKAKEFNTLLYQLMIDDKTNELANNKKLRLHISMKREVVFTACGFFTLDYTLIHSMIAAATTYLVILIQFGERNSGSEKSDEVPINITDAPLSVITLNYTTDMTTAL